MPWKERSQLDQKVSFIARLLDGELMSDLCKEFGISRKTGYKFLRRYEHEGLDGLANKSSRPHSLANLTPPGVRKLIIEAKQKRPTWGAAKLRVLLQRDFPDLSLPSRNTIHAILDREGLVKRRKKRRKYAIKSTPLLHVDKPNELWCADYKGEFKLKNKRYCYPLTISDYASRYLISCDAHDSTKLKDAIVTFEDAFKEYGLPEAIRTDNGTPFAAVQSIHALTKLSAWWVSLGIKVERITPGCP